MPKVVFDTNVIISAALYEESLSALLLSLGLEDQVRFFVSPALQGALHHVTVFLWQRLTNTLLPLPDSMSFTFANIPKEKLKYLDESIPF